MFSPTSTTGTNTNPFAAFLQGAQQWNAEKQAKMAEQRCEAMMENAMAGLFGGPFQGGGMQPQRRAPEERVCFHCGEKGHMKWQCPKLKAQEKEQWLAEARASGLVKQEETSLPSSSTWTSTARSRSGVRASWAAGQRRHAAKLRRRRGRRPSSRSRSRVST